MDTKGGFAAVVSSTGLRIASYPALGTVRFYSFFSSFLHHFNFAQRELNLLTNRSQF